MLTFTFKSAGPADGPALPVCEFGPATLSRVLFGLREGEQASGERLGLGPEEGETEDHVSFLWGNGGNDRQQAASAAKSPALWGHTAFLAVCAVPFWQGRSQTLGLLVGPLRSASCAKSPRPGKTKWRLPQIPSWKPASLAYDVRQPLQLLLLPPLRVLLTASVLCPRGKGGGGVEQPALVFPVLWGSPFARLSAPASPGLTSPFSLQISLYFTKILQVCSGHF